MSPGSTTEGGVREYASAEELEREEDDGLMVSASGDQVSGNTVRREEDKEGGWVEVRDEEKESLESILLLG